MFIKIEKKYVQKNIYIYENKYQDSNTIKQLTLTTATQHYQHTEQTDKKNLM